MTDIYSGICYLLKNAITPSGLEAIAGNNTQDPLIPIFFQFEISEYLYISSHNFSRQKNYENKALIMCLHYGIMKALL